METITMSKQPLPSIEGLRPAFRERLRSMYDGEQQAGCSGTVELDKITRITPEQGMWIYETCLGLKPKKTMEVGMAYGFSTIYFLAAIDQTGTGFHTAIDPFQTDSWHGVGALQARHLNMEQSFRLIEDFGVPAMSRFRTQKDQFEVIYIDGNHRFDDVLVDFTVAAEICPVGGHIILDDMWMRSIQLVNSWILANRKDFRSVPTPIANIAQFERIGSDNRNWDHFEDFYLPQKVEDKRNPLIRRIATRLKKG